MLGLFAGELDGDAGGDFDDEELAEGVAAPADAVLPVADAACDDGDGVGGVVMVRRRRVFVHVGAVGDAGGVRRPCEDVGSEDVVS